MNNLYPWQNRQWQHLLSQYQQQRLPHALLLSGAMGLGKLAFAQRFAEYLLCKSPSTQACGQCSGCHLIRANNHPDLLCIFPEENGKNIKVDQIREMVITLNQTAQRTGYKVVMLAPAEALNKAAANALLKTLEEPAGKVIFILVSHQPKALPATVFSRCQQIQFFGQEHANLWLAEQLQQTDQPVANADLLLRIAEYAPLRALSLAQNNYLNLRGQLLAHLQAISQRQGTLLAPVADYLKQDLLLWTEAFISLATDMLRLQLGVELQWLMNQDCLPQLQPLAQACALAMLLELLAKLSLARQALLNTQVHLNNQLLIESLLIYFDNCFALNHRKQFVPESLRLHTDSR